MRRMADLVFITACLFLIGVILTDRLGSSRSSARAREDTLASGVTVPELAAVAGTTTLVVFLSPTCRFCAESMPFYQELGSRVRTAQTTRLVFPVLGEPEAFAEYLKANKLDSSSLIELRPPAGVTGTPTVLAADDKGRVFASWVGKLDEKQQNSVKDLVR